MKYVIFLFSLMLHFLCVSAQKPALDTTTLTNWEKVENANISNDGKYIYYFVGTNYRHPKTLILHTVQGQQERTFLNADNASFTADNRHLLFKNSGDSLCIFTLSNNKAEVIPYISSYELFSYDKDEHLIYLQNPDAPKLVIRNLHSNDTRTFNNINSYVLSANKHVILMQTKATTEGLQELQYVSLPDGAIQNIWRGGVADNLTLSVTGDKAAFIVTEKTDRSSKTIWLYDREKKNPSSIPVNKQNIDSALQPATILHFSQDGKKLFLQLREKHLPMPGPNAVMVDVWSYTDNMIQSQQLDESGPRNYLAVLHTTDQRIFKLQKENEWVNWMTDETVGVRHQLTDGSDTYWNRAAKASYYSVSTNTGKRKLLTTAPGFIAVKSPMGSYISGREYNSKDLYCYVAQTDTVFNITDKLPLPPNDFMRRESADYPRFSEYRGLSVAAWLDNRRLLIYDDYDIWLLDPIGEHPPVNLTNAYGRKNRIVFRLAGKEVQFVNNKDLLIAAFNCSNKQNGFYKIDLDKHSDPSILTMGPYVYDAPEYGMNGAEPVKAKSSEKHLIIRSSVSESPNYYLTGDFKTFTPVSHVHPEEQYNWMTSELIDFQTIDGRTEQGVLYKPENFDPNKQYPIIFNYYERKSQELNMYRIPGSPNGDLDIAWFVSHEYLVFTPDIYYTIGHTGQSAYNAVVGAAQYLTRLPWANSKKMGLQGHSFGGYETNYLITRTDLFSAAVASSGPTNFVEMYNGLIFDNANGQYFVETFQPRLGTSLWARQDIYIENSPIFHADKVNTPLLMVSNYADRNVPFTQGLEFFLALRRLGKRAWMLQYDKGYHGLYGKEYVDYVMRMTQFFDHYLKGMPPGNWMTRGIPMRSKGIDNGLEPDTIMKTPGPGLLLGSTEH